MIEILLCSQSLLDRSCANDKDRALDEQLSELVWLGKLVDRIVGLTITVMKQIHPGQVVLINVEPLQPS